MVRQVRRLDPFDHRPNVGLAAQQDRAPAEAASREPGTQRTPLQRTVHEHV